MSSILRYLSLARRGVANYSWHRPFCVSFEVTYTCNARCKHCHLGGQAEENRASAERYGELSRELRPVVAQVSGGEPLLRGDVEDIVRAIRRPGKAPFVILTTNGSLLTPQKYFDLRRAGVDEFSLSLDYPDERHDAFRGIPGLFRRIEALVKELSHENDRAITLSCVIQRDNFREILRMAELAREWGMRLNFSTYTWLRTKDMDYMLRKEDISEFKSILNALVEFKKGHDTVYTSDYIFKKMVEYFENGEIPHCRAGERFFVVNPTGTLSPCGLIIRDYSRRKEIRERFMPSNDCTYCYTSIRAATERPARYLITDNLKLRRWGKTV